MKNKQVEIIEETSFYESMVGTVIKEENEAVLVKISFTGFSQQVMFYKNQVKVIG